jgi:hypothetical protein
MWITETMLGNRGVVLYTKISVVTLSNLMSFNRVNNSKSNSFRTSLGNIVMTTIVS